MTEPIPYINGKTGEIIGTVYTEGITRVSRKKLRHFLSHGEDLDIRYNKRLQRLTFDDSEKHVTAYFDDGSQHSGNMVIGCDGSRSKVREYIVGSEAAKQQDLGITMINFPSSHYIREQAIRNRDHHPILKLSFHPELPGTTLLAALDTSSPDPSDWKFQNYTSWWGSPSAHELRDPKVRLDFYRDHMSKFCEPFRSAALGGVVSDMTNGSEAAGEAGETVESEVVLPIYAGQQWSPLTPRTWDNHNGRATLAGDAAHSMLPDRGQGLNNALADADYVVSALRSVVVDKERTLGEAISAYEDEMRPRGGKEVELSFEQALRSKDVKSMAKDAPIFRVGHARQ
ncbi:hypothetical protein PFICI_01175 [Pestalotiopsis fici W106-1]|uniref:FAD-binding domain-containing protein n=1 Tax=Pestalotiopsis fici (strain W106-1 / CGMCC3.15140) TaxID=1229662 RepID=W3XPA7_PESFW|nr:uncharacterized protein PFICI_01175 [Pestalotiopsis fici W106-1]ETS87347.1 hypothetical protein PFICI_01175 [Pestalotiopsis fici W106-1]